MKKSNIVRIVAIMVVFVSLGLLLSSCDFIYNPRRYYATETVKAQEEKEKALQEAIYSEIPEDIYLEIGDTVTYYLNPEVSFRLVSSSSQVLDSRELTVFSSANYDRDAETGKPEDGHFYFIYNSGRDAYICSSKYPNSKSTLRMSTSQNKYYSIWLAHETDDGFIFESNNGYLTVTSDGDLLCTDEGSEFILVPTEDGKSFGMTSFARDRKYRLDCYSSEQIGTYKDDGGVYPHTVFTFFEVMDYDILYNQYEITATTPGNTVFYLDGERHDIFVYSERDTHINLNNPGETVTVRGYELEDNLVHDMGFYSYQCNPEEETVTFTTKEIGKDKIEIGSLTYTLKVGDYECSYNSVEYMEMSDAVASAEENVENERYLSQIVYLESDEVYSDVTLGNGVLLGFNGYYGMDKDDIMFTFRVESALEENDGAIIFPTRQNGEMYLYLPAFADYSALNLHLPEGTIITSSECEGALIVTRNNALVDYTALFGDMSGAGVKFPITVTYEKDNLKISSDVVLVKSAKVDTLFVEVEGEEDDILEWLTSDKNNISYGGFALILDEDGNYLYDTALASFNMRGNTNTGSVYVKSSFSMKLEKKEAILGGVKARSWALVAGNYTSRDTTTYSTAFGETLYQRLNSGPEDDYAIKYSPVDLYINGEYRGMYMLTDKANDSRIIVNANEYSVEGGSSSRWVHDTSDPAIAAGITQYVYCSDSVLKDGGEGGFIVEISGYGPDEAGFFTSRGTPYEIKSPANATKEQVQQIAIYIQKFEDALYSDDGYNSDGVYYADYIDLESFAKFYLVKAFLQDYDFFWGSSYMYIDADETGFTSKLKSCTAWDFDGCRTIYPGADEALFDTFVQPGNAGGGYKWAFIKHDDFAELLMQMNSENVFEHNTMSFSDIIEDMIASGSFIDEYYAEVNNAMSMNKVRWQDCSWNLDGENTAKLIKSRISSRLAVWNGLFESVESLQSVSALIKEGE